MSTVTIAPTGALLVGGSPHFPIVLSNGPPPDGSEPGGRNGLAEVAAAGVSFVRTGMADWNLSGIGSQLAAQRRLLDSAAAYGLRAWLWLGNVPNLPPHVPGRPPSLQEQLLARIADGLQGHPGLGVYKGVDEPRNPFRGADWIRPAGLVRAYERLQQLDGAHPLVITQAPIGTVAQLSPDRKAYDITGADVYPVSYPPGTHTRTGNRDISVVGDVTRKMLRAAGAKPVWMTLQIAWSGVAPSKQRPGVVPRFPTLQAERFMAYQAIVSGARGLVFFGGHLTQVAAPRDATAGWNWTFWNEVLRPLVAELTSAAVAPALVAPNAKAAVKPSTADVELGARDDGTFLYVIAVRRKGTTNVVAFTGLPKKIASGEVLHEYVQTPLPPPIGAGKQVFRTVGVANGRVEDWFAPHDARVYRFRK
jgi:hypothetical protein